MKLIEHYSESNHVVINSSPIVVEKGDLVNFRSSLKGIADYDANANSVISLNVGKKHNKVKIHTGGQVVRGRFMVKSTTPGNPDENFIVNNNENFMVNSNSGVVGTGDILAMAGNQLEAGPPFTVGAIYYGTKIDDRLEDNEIVYDNSGKII